MKRASVLIIVGLTALLVGGFFALFVMQSDEALVVACTDKVESTEHSHSLWARMACTYLKSIRDPDPNQAEAGGHGQTLFGFALAGYDPSNERSTALIVHFIERGVHWDKPQDRALPALHLAVLMQSEDMIARFISAGANPRIKIDNPGHPLHGLDPFGFARLLRTKADEGNDRAATQSLLKIEKTMRTMRPMNRAPSD